VRERHLALSGSVITCEINWELREFAFCVGGESVASIYLNTTSYG